MKRIIVMLLMLCVLMAVFAEESTSTSTDLGNATTEVTLNLNQNIGKVWFSRRGENESISSYALSLPETTTFDNTTKEWIAKGDDLRLNWNIISSSNVKISLSVSGALVNDAGNKKVSWNISFKPLSGGSSSDRQTISAGDSISGNGTIAFTKNDTVYGNNGNLPLSISTENLYGKDALAYKATITATISTN